MDGQMIGKRMDEWMDRLMDEWLQRGQTDDAWNGYVGKSIGSEGEREREKKK